MAAEVSFDDEKIQRFLAGINKNINSVKGNKRQYLGLLSAIVYKDVMEHFQNEEGPQGSWAPWSDAYKKRLEQIGRSGNKILQFNGRLRQNFLPTNYKSTEKGISWFNNAKTKSGFPYAAAHDEGEGNLKKREFMFLSDKAMDGIIEQTLGFILDIEE